MSNDDSARRWPARPFPDVGSIVAERWAVALIVAAAAAQAVAVGRVVRSLGSETYPPLLDSIIFEYIGWSLTRGTRLYVDVFEVKPPLAYEVPALLALLAGGNMRFYHWLNVLVTCGAAIGTALVVGAIVRDLTDDRMAAFLGGLTLFVYPAFHWRPAFGFKVKYFVVLLGLLAIYFARRERPALAGASAAAAVSFWQLAAVFPLLAAGITIQRGDRRFLSRFAAGFAAVVAVVLLPVVYWGAIGPMVVEVLFVSLLVPEQGTPLGRVQLAIRMFYVSLPVVVAGCYGLACTARQGDRRRAWWLPAGALWFALAAVFLDLDNVPDLIPFFAFVALGVGVIMGTDRGGRALAAIVVVMAVLSVATAGGFGAGFEVFPAVEPYALPDRMAIGPPFDRPELEFMFWNRIAADQCRVFYGATQHRLVEMTAATYGDRTCGQFEVVWPAVRDRVPP